MEEQKQPEQFKKVESTRRYSGWAVAGFIIGLFSIPIISPVADSGVIPGLAIIISSIGLNQVVEKQRKGKGFAIAGLVLGILGILYTALVLIFAVSIVV